MEPRSILLPFVATALLLPLCLGREVHVDWRREAAIRYNASSPLDVVAGDKLVINCPQGGFTGILLVDSTIAEQCNRNGGVVVTATPNQYLADCIQNCIALLHQGMEGSSPGYNFLPGFTYFFGDVPSQTSLCQFSMAVRVRENCSNSGLNSACRESTSSIPQPSSTIAPTTTSILTTPTALPLLCTSPPSTTEACSGHALQPHLLTLFTVCALTMATIITSA